MLSNGRGQLNANTVMQRVLESSPTYFKALAKLISDGDTLPEWEGWTPESTSPRLIRLCDGPEQELQSKYPALTFSPESGNTAFPMVNYSFQISYVYAVPKVLATVDIPMLACSLAEEALYAAFRESPDMAGIGWVFNNWQISELKEASTPSPLYCRILTIDITLTIEEDY